MKKLEYRVRFTTPAFLGNAEQSGQWRTPPFKALLRQWWRVAVAREVDYDHQKLREREAVLFGHAWWKKDKDEEGGPVAARASAVRIRLDHWSRGKLTGQNDLEESKVDHPEVGKEIGPLLYVGYGPLITKKKKRPTGGHFYPTLLKENTAAINRGESAELSIAAPADSIPCLQAAIALMNAYGAVGSRSRNGWGSLSLDSLAGTPPLPVGLQQFRRPWLDALNLEWAHAIGCDHEGSPLIWQTVKNYSDWKQVMRDLAIVKIKMRTKLFAFKGNKHREPAERHWLAYPVTNHCTNTWQKTSERLPNTLRFKVRPDKKDPKKLRGMIFHMPCLPPPEFKPDRATIKSVWQRVYKFLDSSPDVHLERIPE